MKSMQTRGLDELQVLKRRAVRSYGLGRIGRADYEYIVKRLDEVEVRIVEMVEYDDTEEGE